VAVVTLQQSRTLAMDSAAWRPVVSEQTEWHLPLLSRDEPLRAAGPPLAPVPSGAEPPSPGPLAGVSRLSRLYLPNLFSARMVPPR
jgi:hypothetical protein